MNLALRRAAELGGFMMIGDGLIAAADPKGHVRLWKEGPTWWTRMAEPFERHHHVTRALAVAELVAGLFLVRWAIEGRGEEAKERSNGRT